jgi:CDGSH-type Zn-finger protein/uncharacterized Fe-S cluster protein YjdI
MANDPAGEPKLDPASAVTGPAGASDARQAGAAPNGPGSSPSGIEEAPADGVVLRFEGKRCIHARFCVLGAPTVFLANVKGPWLHPETVGVEQIAEVAHNCPSGAITYERLDGGPPEAPPPVNVARVRENGPVAVHATVDLDGHGAMFRVTLCRCGASKNKPFCDGSHVAVGFVASGEPPTDASEPLEMRGGTLRVVPTRNGPLAVSGSLEICSGTGRTVKRVTSTALCRCGASSKKPFCDGSHARVGFQSD